MYSLTINTSSTAELTNILKHLETLQGPTPPDFLKRGAATPKAEVTVEEKPAVEKKAKKEKAKEEVPGVAYDQVKAATLKLAGVPGKGPSLVKNVLSEFDVDHATKLDAKDWQKYIDRTAEELEANKPAEELA